MATIAFIGLGNMGGPMARNLLKAGHAVRGFDMAEPARRAFAAAGGTAVESPPEVVRGADTVITMLPAGSHVRSVYRDLVLGKVSGGLFIDCSTIDVASARAVAADAAAAGCDMVDAPVSGGTAGAEAATLTFMVGGSDAAVARAEPILKSMGKTVVHAGGPGTGQAAKICNNMILGATMIATCEAFLLARSLGLDAQKLFDIASKSSGQSWSLTSYCPVPGPVPTSPANRDYKPGFSAAMMLKDLKLAAEAAQAAGQAVPIGALAGQLYALFAQAGHGGDDFSGIVRWLAGR